MNNTILTILTLSASGSILTLIILALRPLLKNKVSKAFQYYIWLLVLLRLALPLSFDGNIMDRIVDQPAVTQELNTSASGDSSGTLTPGYNEAQGNGQNTAQYNTSTDTAANGIDTPNWITLDTSATHFNIWEFAVEHITAIWLLGAAVHFGWFIIAYLRFSRKVKRTSVRPHPKDMAVFVRLRGNSKVQLACNPYIDTPMMVGFPSPCVVIPQMAFVENGMRAELNYILRHELTHYHRRDLLYKWFVVLVSSLHWFNPLMILMRREISRACELSCDEAVVRSMDMNRRQGYGETLLAIASNKRLPVGIVTTTMCEEKRELKERLESIMTYRRKSVLMVALSLGLVLLIAGCSVALGAPQETGQIPDDVSPTPAITDTPGVSETPGEDVSQLPESTDTASVSATPDSTQIPATTEMPAASVSPAPASSSSAGDNTTLEAVSDDPVSAAYKAVLQSKSEFFSIDTNKTLYLNDFLTNNGIYETKLNATHFSVLDMDGDNIPEVVLELSVGNEPQFFEVLHYTNGTVNGYLITYRGLINLKADGTFGYSSGAADSGWGKLIFESNGLNTDVLGYSQSSQDDTDLTISYFINNKPVMKESFDSFIDDQNGKKDAIWYEFSQNNIDSAL